MSSRLPAFLVKKIPKQENIRKIRGLLGASGIHTVCEEAKCPNIGECFSQNTCTFMILGDTCTRNCSFCGVSKGVPFPPDPKEPEKIAEAVMKLKLSYVVITSVTRDDLPDGGAGHFAAVIEALKPLPAEVLIPDFKENLEIVLRTAPFVLNHNVETVPRLYPRIRPQANYERSLEILRLAKRSGKTVYTKSGFMVGLGETRGEIIELLRDLKAAECDIVTIGQYLQPAKTCAQVERYVPPEEFEEYREIGKSSGFLEVFSGPFIRSSFHAGKLISDL
jgi:lipoic acid synthetase